MSQIPSDALSYRTVVSEYFLHLRGAGLLLSPLDEELVSEWERRGLPAAVVCLGLRRGFEEAAAGRPAGARTQRSLRGLRGFVEEEWRVYKDGRVGEAPPPGGEGAAARLRLCAARSRLAEAAASSSGARRAAYLEVAGGLPDEPADLKEAERALRAADDRLLRSWLASLPRPERAALGPRCRLLSGDRSRRARRSSYREALRSHLFDAARRAGVLCLRGTV